MCQRIRKNSVTLLFIVAFLLPRIANLHAISHLSEEEELIACEFCDIVSVSNQFDVITDGAQHVGDYLPNIPSSFIVCTPYNTPKAKIVTPMVIYNKPPPA